MRNWQLVSLLALALAAGFAGAEEPANPAEPSPDPRSLVTRHWESFQQAEEPFLKKHHAAQAIRIAREASLERDEVHEMERYLLDAARLVLELRMPYPFRVDEEGRTLPAESSEMADDLSEDLRAWASSARMDVEEAAYRAMRLQPLDLGYLFVMGDDPRAIAILRQALSLDNYFAVVMAVTNLAEVDDSASVAEIIRVAESAPAEIADLIVDELARFSSAEARAKAEEVLGEEELRRIADRPRPEE